MMDHDRASSLIADLVMGRLDEPDRLGVEEHVEACESCRVLLEQARDLRSVLPDHPVEELLAHVQSSHLTRYALEPAGMPKALVSWIESHLASCAVCRQAVEILRAPEARQPVRSGVAARTGLWDWLGRTLLHPAPALAYLVLLVAVVSVWGPRRQAVDPQPAGPAIELLPPSLEVYPVERLRTGAGEERADPVEIPVGEGELHLRLHTEIDEPVPAEGEPPLALSLLEGDRSVVAVELDSSTISEFGVVGLTLPADLLRPGVTYRIEIRRGDEILFERDLAVR